MNATLTKPTKTTTTKSNPTTTKSNPSTTKKIAFKNINSSYEDSEESEDDEYYQDSVYSNKINNYNNTDDIEGFNGSQIIEGRNLKNILLALLISFFGYIVVISSIKNYLPINEYMPHMKKFKNLIYLGIFFLVTYMCLEAF